MCQNEQGALLTGHDESDTGLNLKIYELIFSEDPQLDASIFYMTRSISHGVLINF